MTMTYFTLPTNETRRLSFYLAMEEYAARKTSSNSPLKGEKASEASAQDTLPLREGLGGSGDSESSLFFLWQVEPTVIFGRHQDIESEVNIPYCQEHGIQFYRRKSGGGCVYADQSNVMMSYITRSDKVTKTFSGYMQMVCGMLRELGLDATSTENNDVLIGGRKVSGNAYYHLPGVSIVHGTMLFDTDMQHMLTAITPPQAKLDKHSVQSVRQRITLLKEHTDLTIEEFKRFAKEKLCSGEVVLTEEDVRNIEAIEQEYLDPRFIWGKTPYPPLGGTSGKFVKSQINSKS